MFPALRLLLRDGDKIELGARAFDVLWTLLEAGGKLVSKDELIDKVWAGAVVEENNLQAQMSAIRRALGPDREMTSTGNRPRLSPVDGRARERLPRRRFRGADRAS